MAKLFIKIFYLIMTGIITVLPVSLAAQTENAPASLAVALTLKLTAFEKNISSSDSISIFVFGAPTVAEEFQTMIGNAIGNSALKAVQQGDTLPEQPPTILFIGPESDIDQAITYSRQHKILSITATPALVNKGVTLGIGVGNDGKPAIKLNLTSTIEEGITWNPAIMKIAKTVK